MIMLIGGASSTGKTLLAQRLMTQLNVPYISLDHIKMGLIRGLEGCPFNTEEDSKIERFTWPIVRGMIMTAIENDQHMIIEGCYIPPEELNHFPPDYLPFIIPFYLSFSQKYLENNFDALLLHQCDIEHRGDEERDCSEFITGNLLVQSRAAACGAKCFVVTEDYESTLQGVNDWASARAKEVLKLRFC